MINNYYNSKSLDNILSVIYGHKTPYKAINDELLSFIEKNLIMFIF